MKGWSEVNGAVSLVSAIPSGKGATVAVALKTCAKVTLAKGAGRWTVSINGESTDSRLAVETVRRCLISRAMDPNRYDGSIETETDTPQSVGLKTSSSSSVAIALATLAALGVKRYSASSVLDCSVKSSLASGVSITGALDDSASCLLGGVNMTDNYQGRLIRSSPLRRELQVLIKVPGMKSRRQALDIRRARRFGNVADRIFNACLSGSYWKAMTLNGFLISSLLGYSYADVTEAIDAGALGAGISGTGPAVAAVFEGQTPVELESRWSSDGSTVIRTTTTDIHGRLKSLD